MEIRLPKVGDKVNIIEKRNYGNGKLTTGTVKKLLSNPAEVHPRGNKVMLEDGTVGRTVSFVDEVGPQPFVDPALREEYAKEVRENLPPRPNRPPKFSDRPRHDQPRERFERNAPAEPPVNLQDLPGEDDLR